MFDFEGQSILVANIPRYRNRKNEMSDWDSLIESTIDAIHVNPVRKGVTIDLSSVQGDKRKRHIVAVGVDDFALSDMRLSNIVDRVSFLKLGASEEADLEIARTLFVLMRGREPGANDLRWPLLDEKLADIRSGALSLIEIEPVHGAAIAFLAKEVSLK